ncbi:hypothetical protein, variant [Cryptococcus amylolentus CBS 6039]|uniref:Ras GEF n=2 Tax=Cryptococcus amylolentus TaxID=104669 RepID=A0A1E3HNH2_9TREE|nr:hypothetical protein, variant [Cryptococcus amylolentus CBS 6039]ODN77887.1 hypothetical protein, variant [Cryptococcus amylolentus CBS 6039]
MILFVVAWRGAGHVRCLGAVWPVERLLSFFRRCFPRVTAMAPLYAQAIHDFDPSLLASTSTSSTGLYLHFDAGELIRVHVRDPTGWWDGEITAKPADHRGVRRGWFPSNYIREIDPARSHNRSDSVASTRAQSPHTVNDQHPSHSHSRHASVASQLSQASTTGSSISQILASPHHDIAPLPEPFQILIQPIVQALSLLDTAIHSNHKSHIQPSTACVISSIRAALAQTDCLGKESKTLVAWPILAKERKVVLVELSKLVGCARAASDMNEAGAEVIRDPEEDIQKLEDLAKAARGVFASVRRFLQLANQCAVEPTLGGGSGIPMSVTSSAASEIASVSAQVTAPVQPRPPPGSNARLQEAFQRRVASIGDLRAAKQRSSSPPPMPSPTSTTSAQYRPGYVRQSSKVTTPISAAFSLSSEASSPISARSLHERRMQGSMDSVFSHSSLATSEEPTSPWEDRTPVPTPFIQPTISRVLTSPADVHRAVTQTEDALLSIIAAFIGHIHSHSINSHPSSHSNLIEMTRETIDTVRDLLTIVETVGRHTFIRAKRPKDIESLRIAKDALYEVAGKLVESAEIVADVVGESGEEGYDKEKTMLLRAATGALRTGTECVRLVRVVVPENEAVNFAVGSAALKSHQPGGTTSQLTPRPSDESPLVSRDKPVGARGVHTLSGLHRKATSLDHLQRKWKDDMMVQSAPQEGDSETSDEGHGEEEEEVIDDKEEDMTMRTVAFPASDVAPRRPSLEALRGYSETGRLGPRIRSSSLNSPMTPRIQHRSPSRSADLDKFTSDDVTIGPGQYGFRDPRSVLAASGRPSSSTDASSLRTMESDQSSVTSAEGDHTTPVAPRPRDKSPKGGLRVEIPPSRGASSLAALSLSDHPTEIPLPPSAALKPPTPTRPIALRTHTAPFPAPAGDIATLLKAHDYKPSDIVFNPDGVMVGASLEVLVEKLTPHDGLVDSAFSDTFFYTFRMFTTSQKLVVALRNRFTLEPPNMVHLSEKDQMTWHELKRLPIQLRVFNFLKSWIEGHWRSEDDDVVLGDLEEFGQEEMSSSLPVMGPRLVQMARARREPRSAVSAKFHRSSASLSTPTSAQLLQPPAPLSAALPPTPVISKNLHALLRKTGSSTRISIAEFDTLELARQLTVTVSKMFRDVKPEEMLISAGESKKRTVKELTALSTHSNQVTGWVADSILNEGDAKKRAGLLKFFIKLADKCLMLNNFFSMFAVLAGLNSSTILRLKKTWDALSAKYRVIIERLRSIIEHSKNHAAYRARLREASPPCLPFLGLILTDITFTSDGNPSTRASNTATDVQLINFDKYAKLGKIAIEFRRYQEPYNFHEVEAVQIFLNNVLTERGSGSIDALYRKSLMLEPRQGSEKIRPGVEKPAWLTVKI